MAGSETDPAKRKALYSEFQKIVARMFRCITPTRFPITPSTRQGRQPPVGIWATVSPLDRVYLK